MDFLYNPVITDKAHADLLVEDAEHSRQPFENLTGLSGRDFASAFLLAKRKILTKKPKPNKPTNPHTEKSN